MKRWQCEGLRGDWIWGEFSQGCLQGFWVVCRIDHQCHWLSQAALKEKQIIFCFSDIKRRVERSCFTLLKLFMRSHEPKLCCEMPASHQDVGVSGILWMSRTSFEVIQESGLFPGVPALVCRSDHLHSASVKLRETPWKGLCNHLYDRDAHISSSLLKTLCWTQNMHLTESNCVFFSCLFFKIPNMIHIPSSGSSNCPFQNPGCFAFLILLCLHTSCIYFHQGPGITIYYVSIFLWLLVLPTAIATTVILDPVWQRCCSSPPVVFPV